MGMFTRFTDIINANINAMLDKAEQPEKMIRLIIQEMEETLVEVRATAAKHIAEKKTLTRQIETLTQSEQRWHEKAEIAINKGRDDLAKSALIEKKKVAQQVQQLEQEHVKFDEFLASVQEDSSKLQEKLSEAKRRQEALLLREQSAVVRLKAKETTAKYDIDQAINRFERYQGKIDRIEAELEAYEMTENKDLSSQIDALATDNSVDDELATLKKKVVNG